MDRQMMNPQYAKLPLWAQRRIHTLETDYTALIKRVDELFDERDALLRACEDALETLNEITDDLTGTRDACRDRLAAAIRKARGE